MRKPTADQKRLEEMLEKFSGTVRQFDVKEDGVAENAFRSSRKILPKVNDLIEKTTGEKGDLSFGKILDLADGNTGVNPEELEELRRENKTLRGANGNFSASEKKYQERILDLEAQLKRKKTLSISIPKITFSGSGKNLNVSEGLLDYITGENLWGEGHQKRVIAQSFLEATVVGVAAAGCAAIQSGDPHMLITAVPAVSIGTVAGITGCYLGSIAGIIIHDIADLNDRVPGFCGKLLGLSCLGLVAATSVMWAAENAKEQDDKTKKVIPADKKATQTSFTELGAELVATNNRTITWNDALRSLPAPICS